MKCDICGQSWTNGGLYGREHKCDPNALARLKKNALETAERAALGKTMLGELIPPGVSVTPEQLGPPKTLTPTPEKLNTVAECLASIVMGRLGIPIEHKKTTTMEDRIFIEQLMLRELTAAYADGKASR